MLAHQLPALPPFEQFWQELPAVFEWLYQTAAAVAIAPATAMASIPSGGSEMDTSWQMPVMAKEWQVRTTSPLHLIRFASANHLCVNLQYQGSSRLIEPYSLRMTKKGDLLLYAVKHNTQEDRSYRVDRIGGAQITNTPFMPKYKIELTASGPIDAPPVANSRKIVVRS